MWLDHKIIVLKKEAKPKRSTDSVVPFIQNSRECRLTSSDRNQIRGCLGRAGERKLLMKKGLLGEGVHYVYCGNGFIAYIYQTHLIVHF